MRKQFYIGKVKLFWFTAIGKFYLHNNLFSLRSLNYGFIHEVWGLIKLYLKPLYQAFMMVHRRYLYILAPKQLQQYLLFNCIKSYIQLLHTILAGYHGYFKVHLFLTGIGRRILEKESTAILMTLGFCHEVLLLSGKHIRFRPYFSRKWKFTLTIFGSNFFDVKHSLFIFQRLRYPDSYNANGIRVLKLKVPLKPRKKWGVF